jgi:Family of unknown function (DUF5343)
MISVRRIHALDTYIDWEINAMTMNMEKGAPYAPFGCVIIIIKRLRERGLPETITRQEITRVGVSEGNASRTLQALKFLKLVDDDGHRSQTFDRLGRVSTSEYAEVFGEIIKEAYRDVFTIVDPAEATDVEINDAFRHYQPQAQRGRMVTLFIALCKEVGLVSGGPPETRQRARTVRAHKFSVASHLATSHKPQTETSYILEVAETLNGDIAGIRLLQGLLQQLPSNQKWTQGRRDRWLRAFTASIDLLIIIESED